jgi:hypothetical protein
MNIIQALFNSSASSFLGTKESSEEGHSTALITTLALMTLAALYMAKHLCQKTAQPSLAARTLSPAIAAPAPRDIPFHTPIILSTDQVVTLQVLSSWLPENPLFNDSYFKSRKVDDNHYEIVRMPWNAQVRHVQSIPLDSFPAFEEFLESGDVAVMALEHLPDDLIGAGSVGQVYAMPDQPLVLKLDKAFTRTGQSERFALRRDGQPQYWGFKYVSPLSRENMVSSFHSAVETVRVLVQLPHHPNILQCQGIAWVADLNQWGVVYEKIEGGHLNDYTQFLREQPEPLPRILHLMSQIAGALKLLDEYDLPYTELKEDNVLVREDETPVIIDLSGHRHRSEASSIESRQQFGTQLYRALIESPTTFKGAPEVYYHVLSQEEICRRSGASPAVADLIYACWSTQSMEEVGWDYILNQLRS